MKYLLATLAFLSIPAAHSYELIKLNELAVDYRNYSMVNPNSHEPVTYPDPPKEALNLEIKLDVLNWFYLDPTVESMTTDAQFRDVGLLLRTGVRISDSVELGLIHHSQHELDRAQQLPGGHFPESDAVQLKVYIFRANPSGRGSIF